MVIVCIGEKDNNPALQSWFGNLSMEAYQIQKCTALTQSSDPYFGWAKYLMETVASKTSRDWWWGEWSDENYWSSLTITQELCKKKFLALASGPDWHKWPFLQGTAWWWWLRVLILPQTTQVWSCLYPLHPSYIDLANHLKHLHLNMYPSRILWGLPG